MMAVVASQTLTVFSSDAVTVIAALEANDRAATRLVCPVSVACGDPLTLSQVRTERSRDAVAMRVPSGENATAVTSFRAVQFPRSALAGPSMPRSPRGRRHLKHTPD